MAATLQDSYDLSNNAVFNQRVEGALMVTCNTVGSEAAKNMTQWTEKRYALVRQALARPTEVAALFVAAAAGNSGMANTYNATSGTSDQKQAAITDSTIATFIAAAWDVIAGVMPSDKGT